MKRFSVIVIALFLTTYIFAQQSLVWIELGLKGGYGSSYLFNQTAFFNDDYVTWNIFSPASTYGGRFSLAFGENANISVAFEGLKTSFSQQYAISDGNNSQSYNAQFDAFSFGLIIKMASPGGFYVEFGPQMYNVKKVSLNESDISNHADKFTSGVIGLGFMPYIGDFVEISLGVRAMASLSSVFNDGYNLYSTSLNANNYLSNNNIYIAFVPMIDINFLIAYMGRASCGAFRVMLNTGSSTRKVRIRR